MIYPYINSICMYLHQSEIPFLAEHQSITCDFMERYLCGYRSVGALQWSRVIGEEVQDGVGPNKDHEGTVSGRSK